MVTRRRAGLLDLYIPLFLAVLYHIACEHTFEHLNSKTRLKARWSRIGHESWWFFRDRVVVTVYDLITITVLDGFWLHVLNSTSGLGSCNSKVTPPSASS